MNRQWFLSCIYLICICSLMFARDIRDTDFQNVAEFTNGSGEGQILFDNRKSGDFPRGVGFFFYQNGVGWVISAPQNQKLLISDDTFKVVKILPFSSDDLPRMIYFDPAGWSINSQRQQALQVWDLKNMKADYIPLIGGSQTPFYPIYFPQYDLYLARSSGQYQGLFDVLSGFSKKRTVISEDQLTHDPFTERIKSLGLRFNKQSIFYRGFVISPSFRDFLRLTGWNVQKNRSDNVPFNPENNLDGYFSGKYDDFDVDFQCVDLSGNYYWVRDSICYVFDREGYLISFIVTPNYDGSYRHKYLLSVHPSGDLFRFLMTKDSDHIKVQVLPNTWAPEAKMRWEQSKESPQFLTPVSRGVFAYPFGLWFEAKVNSNGVRLRKVANLQGEIITNLNSGTPVTILEETPITMRIDAMEAPWYKVMTWDGTQGWIFGAFLDIEKPN